MRKPEPTYLEGTARPYSASYMVFRRDDEVLLMLRSNTGWMDGNYGLPSGRVDEGESPSIAALRETKEEVGLTIGDHNITCVLSLHRHSSGDDTFWIDSYFEITDWEGEPINNEPHKHGEITWVSIDNLPSNMVPSVRFALEKIRTGESYAEYGWEVTETE